MGALECRSLRVDTEGNHLLRDVERFGQSGQNVADVGCRDVYQVQDELDYATAVLGHLRRRIK